MRGFTLKIILGVAIAAAGLILVSLIQEMNRRIQVQREIAKLDQTVMDLEKKVIELESLNQYFRTEAFQEKMAREKLNYVAAGEQVVLIPQEPDEKKTGEIAGIVSKPAILLKWWAVFFGPLKFMDE
jgi:cell division protein FtsB